MTGRNGSREDRRPLDLDRSHGRFAIERATGSTRPKLDVRHPKIVAINRSFRCATVSYSFFCCGDVTSSNRSRVADLKHDFAPRDHRGRQASAALDDGVGVENSCPVCVGRQMGHNPPMIAEWANAADRGGGVVNTASGGSRFDARHGCLSDCTARTDPRG